MKTNYTIKNFAKRLVMVLAVGLMAINAWGATTYKLTQITSADDLVSNALYVFEEENGDFVIIPNVSSSSLQTTTTYSTSGLSGNETYLWKCTSTTGGWYLRKASDDTKYFRNSSSTTISFSTSDQTNNVWTLYFYEDHTISIDNDNTYRSIADAGYGLRAYPYSGQNKETPTYFKIYILEEECSNSVTISKGTGTNCTFTLSTSGAQASCDGVSTTVTVSPNTGYGSPSVTQSGASAAPTITGSGNSWTVAYGANTTGTSTINVSCTAKTYTVTLNDNGGSGGSGSKTVTYNANTNMTSAVAKPTQTHYDFGGYWTSSDAGTTLTTQIIDENGAWKKSVTGYTDATPNWIRDGGVTLYAKWTEHGMTNYRTLCSSTYNVTYDGNGNTDGSVPTDNTDYNSGDEVTVLGNSGSLVKTHYAFDGWNTKADGSGDPYVEDGTFEITKNTTLYAQWACDESITISAGTPTNGSFTLSSTGAVETCSDDVVITVTPSPNTGYNFNAITQTGLNSGVTINQSDKTVTYDQYSSGTTTINVTFVAKTTTVTLNKNGATTGSNQTVSATYGLAMPTTTTSSTALEAPSKNGYTLLGFWDTSETTGGKQYYDANMTSVTSWDKEDATVTLYARWEAKVDRFIDDMHETSGYTSAAPHEESGNYTVPGPLSNTTPGDDCITSHYIFVGWVVSTGQNSSGTLKDSGSRIYRPGETIYATNAIYYAVWAEE